MLRTAIISPDTELAASLRRALVQDSSVSIIQMVDHYRDPIDLTRMLGSHAPHAVFVCVSIALQIYKVMPGAQVVAVGRPCEPATLMEIMEAGIPEYLAAPFERTCVSNCLKRIRDYVEDVEREPVAPHPSGRLYSFLPSKPGVGAKPSSFPEGTTP